MTDSLNENCADDLLKSQCILVTRSAQQAFKLSSLLKAHGAEVEELPLLRICPPDSYAPLDQALACLDQYAWLVFASASAVETTLARAHHPDVFSELTKINIACIGPATEAALSEYGLKAQLVPASAVAESLLQEFPEAPLETSGRRVLWPRTNIGRMFVKDALEKSGWQVDIVHSYKTAGPENMQASAEKLRLLLQSGKLSIITLTSSEAARKLQEVFLLAAAGDIRLPELFASVKLAVIGPETARTCRSVFGRVNIQAANFTVAGLVQALISECSK